MQRFAERCAATRDLRELKVNIIMDATKPSFCERFFGQIAVQSHLLSPAKCCRSFKTSSIRSA